MGMSSNSSISQLAGQMSGAVNQQAGQQNPPTNGGPTPIDGAPSNTWGQPQIGMPAGPGYMQPGQISSGGKGGMSSTPTQGPEPTFNFSPDFGNPSIGLPAGPGYMQPTPLPTPAPINMPGSIGMPTGPGYMQPTPLPTPKPTPAPITMPASIGTPAAPAPQPQTMEQIRQQVGLRQNPNNAQLYYKASNQFNQAPSRSTFEQRSNLGPVYRWVPPEYQNIKPVAPAWWNQKARR